MSQTLEATFDCHDIVVAEARLAHAAHWRMSGDEGTGDKLAKLVTDTWQAAVRALHSSRLLVEYKIAPHLRERIDVVDRTAGVAYEMKVSPNNVHMKFYKDIFKALMARDNGLPHLKRFVFLTPQLGAQKLSRGLGHAVVEHGKSFGLSIEVVSL